MVNWGINADHIFLYTEQQHMPGEGTSILGIVVRFHSDDPRFWKFQSDWVPIVYLITIWLTPVFLQIKNQFVSITCSSIDTKDLKLV